MHLATVRHARTAAIQRLAALQAHVWRGRQPIISAASSPAATDASSLQQSGQQQVMGRPCTNPSAQDFEQAARRCCWSGGACRTSCEGCSRVKWLWLLLSSDLRCPKRNLEAATIAACELAACLCRPRASNSL